MNPLLHIRGALFADAQLGLGKNRTRNWYTLLSIFQSIVPEYNAVRKLEVLTVPSWGPRPFVRAGGFKQIKSG